jgi:hypothetical protein
VGESEGKRPLERAFVYRISLYTSVIGFWWESQRKEASRKNLCIQSVPQHVYDRILVGNPKRERKREATRKNLCEQNIPQHLS